MKIDQIRIYAEVLEQGLDFKDYVKRYSSDLHVINVYTKKGRTQNLESDSLIDRIRNSKDVDVLISAVCGEEEFPLLLTEYSMAVPTDDHKMQRSDDYYWGGIYRVPELKISPVNKGMDMKFGGGGKFSDNEEKIIAYRHGAIFYPLGWDSIPGKDVLQSEEGRLSCIYFSQEIQNLINLILSTFLKSNSFEAYYPQLLFGYQNLYKELFDHFKNDDLHSMIVNSSRFSWEGKQLVSKINRFGHAMDPDRGVLYFSNMLVGFKNAITEIQVNRPLPIDCRGGYSALFDATAHKESLLKYVQQIIEQNNNEFSVENAIHVFRSGLSIGSGDLPFVQTDQTSFVIENNALEKFLLNYPSITAKCIFFLSHELRLTDKNRKIICSISWNEDPVNKFLNSLYVDNFIPLRIEPLSMANAKEDIITFASVELYKKLQCELVAVSYPGAQGDRAILVGSGRKVDRTYVDIIAYRKHAANAVVYLQESKDDLSKSPEDALKLKKVILDGELKEGLGNLLQKIEGASNVSDIFSSVGAKDNEYHPYMDVDYMFLFSIISKDNKTFIRYLIAISNTKLLSEFSSLKNADSKLAGVLSLDEIFVIS